MDFKNTIIVMTSNVGARNITSADKPLGFDGRETEADEKARFDRIKQAVMEELRRVRLEPKRLRFVHHTAAASPSLFLLEARLGGRPGLTAEPPLLLRGPDGGETEDVRRAYFRDKE